jgi:hypothetical protein
MAKKQKSDFQKLAESIARSDEISVKSAKAKITRGLKGSEVKDDNWSDNLIKRFNKFIDKTLEQIPEKIETPEAPAPVDDDFDYDFNEDQSRLLELYNKRKMATVEIQAAFDFADSASDKGRSNKVRTVRLNVLNKEIPGLVGVWQNKNETAQYLANETRAGAFMGGGNVHKIRSIELL